MLLLLEQTDRWRLKDPKIDRHPEEFKDFSLRGFLKIANHSSTNLHLHMPFSLLYGTETAESLHAFFVKYIGLLGQ